MNTAYRAWRDRNATAAAAASQSTTTRAGVATATLPVQKPRAAVAAPHGRLDLVERIPDPSQLVLGDPDAVVLHRHPHLLALPAGQDPDLAARRAELHGVADEVDEDLLQPRGIGLHRRQVGRQHGADVDATRLRGRGHHRPDLPDDLAQVEGAGRQLDASRLEARDVEQIVDEVVQALRAPEDRLLILDLLRRERAVRLAQEEPAVADDRGQWRAQLVAHHREELRLQLVEAPQLCVDLRERARLAILLSVVADHLRVVAEHGVPGVEGQKRHRGDGP